MLEGEQLWIEIKFSSPYTPCPVIKWTRQALNGYLKLCDKIWQ